MNETNDFWFAANKKLLAEGSISYRDILPLCWKIVCALSNANKLRERNP